MKESGWPAHHKKPITVAIPEEVKTERAKMRNIFGPFDSYNTPLRINGRQPKKVASVKPVQTQ